MALDINEARKGSGEPDAFLGLAKKLTDFGERQSFLRMKDMPLIRRLGSLLQAVSAGVIHPMKICRRISKGRQQQGLWKLCRMLYTLVYLVHY